MKLTRVCSALLQSLSNKHVGVLSTLHATELRERLAQHVLSQNLDGEVSVKQSELKHRRMSDSWTRVALPLGSDSELREMYLSSRGHLRFGQILEDLDSFAVWLGYSHNQGNTDLGKATHHPMGIVTACVDRIDVPGGGGEGSGDRLIKGDKDIVLEGHVSYVGRSSLEASIRLLQEVSPSNWKPVLSAIFIMVAKSPVTGKTVPVHPLSLTCDEEKSVFDEGAENTALRKRHSAESLMKTHPSDVEQQIIHDLFLQTLDSKRKTFKHRILPHNFAWMEDQKLKNVHIMFPQQRNLYGKIFGGFLMRTGFELAWANAYRFSHSPPMPLAVDDIMFVKSVEVGSLLYLSSEICYTDGSKMQVRVHAEVVNPLGNTQETTNTFQFTFTTRDGSNVRSVMPQTYADGMLFLDGRRHFREAMKHSFPN